MHRFCYEQWISVIEIKLLFHSVQHGVVRWLALWFHNKVLGSNLSKLTVTVNGCLTLCSPCDRLAIYPARVMDKEVH